MLRLQTFQTGVVLLLTACGGNVAIDGAQTPGSNANGGQGAAGASGGATTAATGGNGSGLSGGLVPITLAQWDQINDAACAGTSEELEAPRYLLEFVVDTSSTMADVAPNSNGKSKWAIARDALAAAVDSYPDNTAVGLLLYPNQPTVPNESYAPLSVKNCVNVAAAVSPQALGAAGSAQREAIASGLAAATIQGGKPTEDAYLYALNVPMSSDALNNAARGYQPIVVLITDGTPTIALGCEGSGQSAEPVDPQPIIQDISAAWTGDSINTLVIGLPSSPGSADAGPDPRIWMSEAARAGQTSVTANCGDSGIPNFCHFDLTNVTDLQSGVVAILQSITATTGLFSCSFQIPPPTSGAIPDLTKIYVVYNQDVVNGVPTAQFLVGQSNPDCPQGDGWYVDESMGAIDLCAKTCATIQQDPNGGIDIRQGCAGPIPFD